MKKVTVLLILSCVATIAQQANHYFIGDGGKGISLTILAPTANGLAKNQSYLPALVQGEFVSNFSGYSAISVLDRQRLEEVIYHELASPTYDDKEIEKLWDLGRLAPTTHIMSGKITKTVTGYALQMNITKTSDKTTVASYSGTFTFAELDNLTGIRRASLDLLPKMGVMLSEQARVELAGAVAEIRINAQTALAKGVTAQWEKCEVAALSYYFQAITFDPSLVEATNRSSKLNAEIASGNIGENIRNDIQWRKDWIARLTETELFFDNINKTGVTPYTLYYSDEIEFQGKINYKNETVNLNIGINIFANSDWVHPIERALQTVYDGLNATERKESWGLNNWPRQGVINPNALNIFAERKQKISVVFELVNNRNKVIGKQTLQTWGSWGFNWNDRPSVEVFIVGKKTVHFQNVNANDITDRMTIRVVNINGETAQIATKKGILQIWAGIFTDSRDGKSYRTVRIGNLTWMAENLNHQTNNSKCYGNDASNCAEYGRLYNWNDAMSACPDGWRLPTNDDWDKLVGISGGDDVASKRLKSTSGWSDRGSGVDYFGFSALPGGFGYSDGYFNYVGRNGRWWSAREDNAGYVWGRYIDYNFENVFRYHDNSKTTLFSSVRCLQE